MRPFGGGASIVLLVQQKRARERVKERERESERKRAGESKESGLPLGPPRSCHDESVCFRPTTCEHLIESRDLSCRVPSDT